MRENVDVELWMEKKYKFLSEKKNLKFFDKLTSTDNDMLHIGYGAFFLFSLFYVFFYIILKCNFLHLTLNSNLASHTVHFLLGL